MSRIQAVLPEKAAPELKTMYESIKKRMNMVPNIFKNMGNSPIVLRAYLGFSDAASQTKLSPKIREEIALVVSQANQCNYCLSAHTLIAKMHQIPDQEILLARKGDSQDMKTKAILKFSKSVVEKRGKITDDDMTALKAAGVNDSEFAEIFLVIMENMFTNYFNNITEPDIDFPKAPSLN
jgi:uncharacterized peroxidase-related enzyme